MTSVLIVGAGIAGPTLAYWLLEYGFQPTIVERASTFRAGGYMIDFWGVGFDVADRMKLLPALRSVGYAITGLRFVDALGETRSRVDAEMIRRAAGDRFASVRRGDLARLLFETVSDRVEILFGESVTALREDETGVDVAFGRHSPRRFDLVVGCDGLHSEIRTIAFGAEERFERYLGCYAASFLTTDYPHRDEHTYLSFAAPGRQISRYALRAETTAFLLVFRHPEKLGVGSDPLVAKRILHETFAGDGWVEIPEILARLEECNDVYFDSVSQIHLPRWSRGRVALVGDAAYCPSLLAGEGAGFAMVGAYVLAGELARFGGDCDYPSAFAAYENRLRAFIDGKQRAAVRFARSFIPATRLGLFIRDQIVRVAAFPLAARWLTRGIVADDFELPSYS